MPPLKTFGVACLLLLAAGCGVPPELNPPPRAPTASTSPAESPAVPPGFSPRPSVTTSPSASRTPFPLYSAVPCAGNPTADQISSLVRQKASLVPGKALTGPLCAGTWQYTLFEVPGKESVHVVSIATASGLTLFAAGTDVCTADVQQQAPFGIRLAASC
jgi:hypothetical protein